MFLHSVNLWNLAFYALMVFMATLGLWDVFFDFEENKCSMSYMFEYPEYQVSFLPLFAWALQTRAPPAWPSCGVPLLWLPAPFRRPHPNLTSVFSAPEDSAEPHYPAPLTCPLCPLFTVDGFLDGFLASSLPHSQLLPCPSALFAIPNASTGSSNWRPVQPLSSPET